MFDTLSVAYVQAVLAQFTINTPASIQVATAALAGLRSAQQPQIVQVLNHHLRCLLTQARADSKTNLLLQAVFQQAFVLGLTSQAALTVGTLERMGPCTNNTFFPAQYALALGVTMTANETAAGLALAAALNADLAGCAVAAATGIPLLEAGCSTSTLSVLASKP